MPVQQFPTATLPDRPAYETNAAQTAGAFPSSASSEDLLRLQANIESNARSYPYRLPLVVEHASGIYVTDRDGRQYIDCLACAGALPLGHNPPEVTEAVIAYLRSGGPMQALDLMTPARAAFIDALYGVLPPRWRDSYRIQFCGPGGSDAVEAAIKLVKFATGRENVLSFHGAYHGMSQFSLGMTGNLKAKGRIHAAASHIHFLPYPAAYRSPFHRTHRGDPDDVADRNFHYLRNILSDPESGIAKPAGLILELIQGEGGVIPAPTTWVQALRGLTRDLEIPLIVDEVQTGLGRTGDMFAFEQAGIEPDVLILSKAIGGGFPMAVILFREDLNLWPSGAHAGTFRGNQIAMVAGRATLEIMRRDDVVAQVRRNGAYFRAELETLQKRYDCIGDVRGRGLMLGAEIVAPDGALDVNGHPAPAPELAANVQQAALQRGLILEVGGRYGSVLRFLPPLIIQESEIRQVIRILDDALDSVTCSRATGSRKRVS